MKHIFNPYLPILFIVKWYIKSPLIIICQIYLTPTLPLLSKIIYLLNPPAPYLYDVIYERPIMYIAGTILN